MPLNHRQAGRNLEMAAEQGQKATGFTGAEMKQRVILGKQSRDKFWRAGMKEKTGKVKLKYTLNGDGEQVGAASLARGGWLL